MDLENLIEEINELMEAQRDYMKRSHKYKSHAMKARVNSVKLAKKLKEFRALSIELGLK